VNKRHLDQKEQDWNPWRTNKAKVEMLMLIVESQQSWVDRHWVKHHLFELGSRCASWTKSTGNCNIIELHTAPL